jgi:hypothetical protein
VETTTEAASGSLGVDHILAGVLANDRARDVPAAEFEQMKAITVITAMKFKPDADRWTMKVSMPSPSEEVARNRRSGPPGIPAGRGGTTASDWMS